MLESIGCVYTVLGPGRLASHNRRLKMCLTKSLNLSLSLSFSLYLSLPLIFAKGCLGEMHMQGGGAADKSLGRSESLTR